MKKRPYLTEKELNAPVDALKIKIYGKWTHRAKHSKKEVHEDHFDAFIDVPVGYHLGHIKLMANRYIKKELKGIRAKEYFEDKSVPPVPSDRNDYRVRDFMSDMTIEDNRMAREDYKKAVERARQRAEDQASDDYMPPPIEDTTEYGPDGLPKLLNGYQGDGDE